MTPQSEGTIATFSDGYYHGEPEIAVERVRPGRKDRPPFIVLDEMATVMNELSGDSSAYSQALTHHAAAKLAYERERAKSLTILVHEHRQRGDRLPAEDVRNALTLNDLEAVYAPLLETEARVEALKASINVKKAVLSGLQSELAQLRTEVGG